MSQQTESYPGGKGGAGVYQRLINQIPPHDIYIETHLGGGAIMRLKRPAALNFGIDIDSDVITSYAHKFGFKECTRYLYIKNGMASAERFEIAVVDACVKLAYIPRWPYSGRIFIFSDPPYLMETRKSGPLYRYEYTREQHIELLELLLTLDAMIMITGYRSKLYDDKLSAWRRIDYMAPTRHGLAPESAWMNYPEPVELHDYGFLGKGFRERERIKRKVGRWTRNLEKLPPLERMAIVTAIKNNLKQQSCSIAGYGDCGSPKKKKHKK